MRLAYYVLILTLILSLVNAINPETYTASDMRCWTTSKYSNSNPLSLNRITIPTYVKKITLAVSKGGGTDSEYFLSTCDYNNCGSISGYASACTKIGTYRWGDADLTQLLQPGQTYDLRLESSVKVNSLAATQVSSAILSIEKSFLYNVSQFFEYSEIKTVKKAVANVYAGNGNCSIPIVNRTLNANQVLDLNAQTINSNINEVNQTVDFACSEGNYTISLDLPAVEKQVSYAQDLTTQSDINTQYIQANLHYSNPSDYDYSDVPFNFTLSNFVNTTGNTYEKKDINAQSQVQKTINGYMENQVQNMYYLRNVKNITNNQLQIDLTYNLTNNAEVDFINLNTSPLTQTLEVQNLTSKNYTCTTLNVVDLPKQSVKELQVNCVKENPLNATLKNITVISASLTNTNFKAAFQLTNFEDFNVNLNTQELLSALYNHSVSVNSTIITINAGQSTLTYLQGQGDFINENEVTFKDDKNTYRRLNVSNETGFNAVNVTGSISISEMKNAKLRIYQDNGNYSDITPQTTCPAYSNFSIVNGFWQTCIQNDKINFVIPHFSTVQLESYGETPTTPQSTPGNTGSNSGGSGGSTVSTRNTTSVTSVEKSVIQIPQQNLVVFDIPMEITLEEFTEIGIKVNGVGLEDGIVKFVRPDGTVKTQIAKSGEVDFFADKQGEWTIEYNDVREVFIVKSKNELNALATPSSSSSVTGFSVAMPSIPLIPLTIAALLAVVIYLGYKKYSQKKATMTREVNGNKVTITITNSTNAPLRNLTLTEVLPEGSKITNQSQQFNTFKEMLHGDEYTWKREVIAPKQKWITTYETSRSANLTCNVTCIGVNNSLIVIKPSK